MNCERFIVDISASADLILLLPPPRLLLGHLQLLLVLTDGRQLILNGHHLIKTQLPFMSNDNNQDNHDDQNDQNDHKTNPALSVFHSLVRASQLVFHHCQRPSQVVVPGHDYSHDCPVYKFTVTNNKSTSKSYFISFSEAILRASLVFLSKPSSSTWST